MRIAIGQLWQETNTFNPRVTTRRDFEDFGVLRGADIIAHMSDTNELGAFIQSLRAWPEQPEIVGLVRLPAWPSGWATAETYDWIQYEFIDSLQQVGPVDAVLLALHGSLCAQGTPDVEGALLAAIRQQIGPQCPLVCTLDLHANITQKMVDHTNALVLFHTAPHIDVFETGQRGAKLLRRILTENASPTTAWVKLPLVVPAERANTQDPTSVSYELRKRLQRLEATPNILTAGLATVQPWLDIPELGTAVVLTTNNDLDAANRYAHEIADYVWDHREDYLPELTDLQQAVQEALATPGLVIISDSADATTSGAPGDSNQILRELVKYEWVRQVLVPVVSPEIVELASQAGVGNKIDVVMGGQRDPFSVPLPLTVRVERIFDGQFTISGHLAKNLAIDMGSCAVVTHRGISIIVTSRSGPHFAPEFFQTAGFNPFAEGLLIAKSPCGFRAAYQSRSSLIRIAQVTGCARSDFWNLPYQTVPRPLWPWDRNMQRETSPLPRT